MFKLKVAGLESPVDVEAIYADETYGGWLEGLPREEALVRQTTTDITERVEKLWGVGRPVHVIAPKVAYLKTVRGMTQAVAEKTPNTQLPKVRVLAWLSSWTPVHDSKEDGSHVFVAWFQDDGDLSKERVQAVMAELPWREVAKDFSV